MKKLFLMAIMAIAMATCCTSCDENGNSEYAIRQKQRQLLEESNAQLGMPAIVNFQEKKLAKMIFELRDKEDLICYAYIVNHMTGQLVFIGKCMGYGLPYSTQYTNPMQRGEWREEPAIPQADPNGLYMPEGMSATWLMMIDPETNQPRPVYIEPEIVVSPFKLH